MKYYNELKKGYMGYSRWNVLYTKDFPSIIDLKKELRRRTDIHPDFYKRSHGFYNDVLEFFFYLKDDVYAPSSGRLLLVETEEDAKEVKEDILRFLDEYYTQNIFWKVKDFGNGVYDFEEISLSSLEMDMYLHGRGCYTKQELYDTKKEAMQSAYRHISANISKLSAQIRKLEEKQKELEYKITGNYPKKKGEKHV